MSRTHQLTYSGPNAGHPKRVGHRNIYMATEEYMLVYAKRLYKCGVKMVGGCCGTRPEHIGSVQSASKMFGGGGEIVQVRLKFNSGSSVACLRL